jgi:acyl-CoA reductase-like NAD-dependent aldehyde dehydrogenase
VAASGPADAALAAAAAREAFDDRRWSGMSAPQRAKVLNRVADLIEERAEDLAFREVVDMGKLWRDAMAIDIPHVANMFRYFAGWTTKLDGAVKTVDPVGSPGPVTAFTRRQPLGVVAAITPFNFPLLLTVSKIAPALAAGNTFIHKPSTDTPLSAIAMAEIMMDAGVPEGAYNLLTGGGGAVGHALVVDPRVDKVALTGSTNTGRTIIRDSADSLKHLTMELGGKSPNIIFADANLDVAVPTAFYAIFWNKGEVCVAGSRLLVQRPVYDEVVERLAAMCATAKTGDPFDPATDFGPIASRAEYDKVLRYIDVGRDEDKARLVTGGNALKIGGRGLYIEPRGDLRAGAAGDPLRHRGGRRPARQRHRLRPGRRCPDAGRRQGAARGRAAGRRDGVDQHLAPVRPGGAVRRVQGQRLRARERRRGVRELHAPQDHLAEPAVVRRRS